MENFITKIRINNSRNISDFQIDLSETERKHLILTGKNGSGKTSLMLELNKFLTQIENGLIKKISDKERDLEHYQKRLSHPNIHEEQKTNTQKELQDLKNWFAQFGGTVLSFSNSGNTLFEKYQKGEFILAFFDSKRHIKLNLPTGINKINLKKKYGLQEKVNENFIQYIVNLKADRSFARDENEEETVKQIDTWFERFTNRLKEIFELENLELRFDRKTYNFELVTDDIEPFNFNTLSDGYSAIISIVTELLLRMEAHNVKSYDLEGIVLIDEIEISSL